MTHRCHHPDCPACESRAEDLAFERDHPEPDDRMADYAAAEAVWGRSW